MYDAPTDIELIARHRIAERSAPVHQAPPRAARTSIGSGSRPRRRTQLAGTLRRVADRLDP